MAPMKAERTWRRLLTALADSAPAFRPSRRPVSDGRARRLLSAVADSRPAFQPCGHDDAFVHRAGSAAPPFGTFVGGEALSSYVDAFRARPAAARLQVRGAVRPGVLVGFRHLLGVADLLRQAKGHRYVRIGKHHDVLDAAAAKLLTIVHLMEGDRRPRTVGTALRLALEAVREERRGPTEMTTGDVAQRSSALDSPVFSLAMQVMSFELLHAVLDADRAEPERSGWQESQVNELLLRLSTTTVDGAYDRALLEGQIRFLAGHLHLKVQASRLWTALSDVTGADLRQSDLGGVPLEGIRWSEATQWPPAWEDSIRARSTAVQGEPGVYEIGLRGVDLRADTPIRPRS